MLLVRSENQLEKVANKYPKGLVLFNVLPGVKKMDFEAGDKKMVIETLDLMPSRELIKDYQDGNIGRKKLIKKHMKRFDKMETSDMLLPQIYELVTMATKHKGKKKNKLVALVLIEEDKKMAKLYVEILELTMKAFGIKFMNKKQFKKVFKGSKKKVAKALNDYILGEVNLSDKGTKVFKKIKKNYAVELAHISVNAMLINGEKIKGDTLKILKEVVIGAVKANKKNRKAYEALRELELPGMKLPKVKKIKDIKRDERLILTINHMAAIRSGEELGSKGYYDFTKGILKATDNLEAFKEAVKTEAK